MYVLGYILETVNVQPSRPSVQRAKIDLMRRTYVRYDRMDQRPSSSSTGLIHGVEPSPTTVSHGIA